MGRGNPKSRIVIYGEAPGASEAETGKVFSGRAGQLLDHHLREAGLADLDPYVSNVVKCRPPENRTPDRPEWESCRLYLERELEAVDPRHVLLLGNTALRAVAKSSGIMKKRGTRLVVKDYPNIEFMATMHPAAVLRNPGWQSLFAEDIHRFARMVRDEFRVVPVKRYLVQTKEGLRRLKKRLMEAEIISYDVETRYMPWNPEWGVVCLGVATTDDEAYVVPLYHPESVFEEKWQKVMKFLKPCFEREDCKYVAQNGKFDNQHLAGCGIFNKLSFDIMLAAHLLNENRPKNLGFLSQTMLGADAYKGTVDLKPDKILTEPMKKIAQYNGSDVAYTLQIYRRVREQLIAEPRLLRIFTKLMMPASEMIQKVEFRGIYMDKERLWDRMEDVQRRIDEARSVLGEHGAGDLNPNSPAQLGRWLFSAESKGGLGLDPLELTRTGKPSTREGVLLHYRDHPAIQALMRYRMLQLKWMNTYLLPWSMKLDSRSRYHTIYKLYGTVTGRLSGDFQQVPRDPFIRSIVGAPPGRLFVSADYSQIEMRIAAHCAQERRMMRAFHAGEDLHLITAATVTGKAPDQITKEERKKAKAVNFGFLYGMYPKKFQDYAFENYDISLTMDEAKDARRRFFNLYPDLPKWYQRQQRVVEALHRVQSPIGRVRHLPDVLSSDDGVRQEAIRQSINSPVQSCASDLMLYSMVLLDARLDPAAARLVGTLHDGIFLEVREDRVEEVAQQVKDVMENLPLKKTFGLELSVPIVADVEWGQHWGEPVASI